MRLRRSVVSGPGLHRVRRGRGFSYHDQEGKAITDEATLTRIKGLVIPPAWKNVWISPHPSGHIQAVGTDVAGRRQYLYHEKWQQDRAEEKFDRVLEMSKALPDMRRQINADLKKRGLERDRVLALALQLLDLGFFRAGGEQYAEENNSFGIATLLCEHVALRRQAVEFDFPAKSGVRRTLLIEDAEVVRSVCALMRKPDTPAFAATPAYIGFDVGTGLVVGYGLDYRGRYRNLRCAAVLAPHVYRAAAPSSSPPP